MKIKDRIALQFTLLVAGVLLLFSIVIYSVSEHYRQEEFLPSTTEPRAYDVPSARESERN